MPKVFISYNRSSIADVERLADDIRALGYAIWFDQELAGGQKWWDGILESVRSCDVFIFAMTSQSLSSTACMREYEYAWALRKHILPVLIADDVSTNLLPAALSQIQFVDYRSQSHSSAIRLARALAAMPPVEPLPTPLPQAPPAPVSHLNSLMEQIDSRSVLSYEHQSALIVELKGFLLDTKTSADARTLLIRLRGREDLLRVISGQLDELLRGTQGVTIGVPESLPVSRPPAPAKIETPIPSPTFRQRTTGALCGAILGLACAGSEIAKGGMYALMSALYLALWDIPLGALAGAIVAMRLDMTTYAIAGAIILAMILAMIDRSDLAVALMPLGATLGVAAGMIARAVRARFRLKIETTKP